MSKCARLDSTQLGSTRRDSQGPENLQYGKSVISAPVIRRTASMCHRLPEIGSFAPLRCWDWRGGIDRSHAYAVDCDIDRVAAFSWMPLSVSTTHRLTGTKCTINDRPQTLYNWTLGYRPSVQPLKRLPIWTHHEFLGAIDRALARNQGRRDVHLQLASTMACVKNCRSTYFHEMHKSNGAFKTLTPPSGMGSDVTSQRTWSLHWCGGAKIGLRPSIKHQSIVEPGRLSTGVESKHGTLWVV